MGKDSAIEWCHHTFNPWIGCTQVSPGCANCYAAERDRRFHGGEHWGPGAPRRVTSPVNWREPLKWNRQCRPYPGCIRPRVFCGSLCDVFDPEAPEGAREWLAWLIDATPHLDWLLLTKRPENIPVFWPSLWRYLPNIWVGTTVENEAMLERVQLLANVPARRFLSMEPLLEAVKIPYEYLMGPMAVSWIIVGGESGPKARPMHPDWVRSIRDQCAEAGVPFFFKQWGAWAPTGNGIGVGDDPTMLLAEMARVGKKAAGRLLDGVENMEFPT
jgi:protein gp37